MTTSITPYREPGITPALKAKELYEISLRNFHKKDSSYELKKIGAVYFSKLMEKAHYLSSLGETTYRWTINPYLAFRLFLISKKRNSEYRTIKIKFLNQMTEWLKIEGFKTSEIRYYDDITARGIQFSWDIKNE